MFPQGHFTPSVSDSKREGCWQSDFQWSLARNTLFSVASVNHEFAQKSEIG